MNIVLCGYNWTGCKALQLLLSENHKIFVYTHTTENCCADLEGLCMKKQVPYSLEKISINNLPFEPDVICSIYYRYIIEGDVIEKVKGKIFNLHPSLLPDYRGCSSLTWAMINGESKCGFTYHLIDQNCDTGNILYQQEMEIEEFDTQMTLYNRVMYDSMVPFLDILHQVIKGERGVRQEGESVYYKRGCPLNGNLDIDSEMTFADRFIRAMINPPYQAAKCNGIYIHTLKEFLEFRIKSGKDNDLC